VQSLDRTPVIVAAAASGTAAVLVFALLPILGGALADHYQLGDVQTGLVATSYFSVYALIALTSSAWIRKFNWVITARVGFAGMLAGLASCMMVDSFVLSSISLAVVGAGAGLLFPISLTLVSDMEHTDRNYAIKIASEQLVPAGVLFLLSSTLFAGYGLHTLLIALIAVVALCLLFSTALPARGNQQAHDPAGQGGRLMLAVLSLCALSTNFAGFAGIWAFLERIGTEQAFGDSFTNTWLAVGLITSGVGPLMSAVAGDRFGRTLPLLLASTIAVVSLLLLAGEVSRIDFAAVLVILPLAYYFSIAYMFSVVAEADHNGRMSGLMSFALAIGAASGPAIFGAIKVDGGPVVMAMGALIAVGASCIIWIHTRLQIHHEGAQL
jgi:predicted MFS family arabinose efflux permease